MASGRLSGVLTVTLTARTPLLIGGFPDKRADPPRLPRRRAPQGRVMIPGSGILGAVRSVHEVLAGGCLRVLDVDWVPVHRHPANASETQGLTLGVVTKVDGKGQPLRVAACEEWLRVPLDALRPDQQRLPQTGDQFCHQSGDGREIPIPAAAVVAQPGRRTLRVAGDSASQGVRPGSMVRIADLGQVSRDCWVLLVTDTRARSERQQLHFAAGRVGPGSRSYLIPPGTWEKYRQTVAGADDLRPAVLADAGPPDRAEPPSGSCGPEYADVTWPPGTGQPVARRLRARSYLHVGQPVWVRVSEENGEVTEIRLSMLWRYQGDGTVGERIGNAGPCTDPESLCWSCRVFGSADTGGRRADDPAAQRGYRGHVRFEDLLAAGDVDPVRWHLAPLSSPQPGAGQFYLDNTGLPSAKRLSAKDTRPAATWGSAADKPGLRSIRGRKFYWRAKGDPTAGPYPRGRFRDHQAETLARWVELIPAGTVFAGRVRFDNLSAEDYGSLLAALDPRLLATADDQGWRNVVTSAGGGKPFGFGAVTIDVEPEMVQTARMRYLGEPPAENGQVPDVAAAVRAFRDRVPHPVRAQWARLRHALTPGYADDDLVWYPPAPGAAKGSKEFDESFQFFQLTNGRQMTTGDRPLVDLPDPAGSPDKQVLQVPAQPGGRAARGPRRDGRRGRA